VFTERRGRVGLPGVIESRRQSVSFKPVTQRFISAFKFSASKQWKSRYSPPCREGLFDYAYNFVELDYRNASSGPPDEAFIGQSAAAQTQVPDEVRDLMELILHGGPSKGAGEVEIPQRDPFTAPYGYLSAWTLFLASKTLQCILNYFNSDTPIRWRFLLEVSQRYRSLIPCCSGLGRPPVISNYHSLYLELTFLAAIWPKGASTVDALKIDAYRNDCLQAITYNTLSHPLHHAYSSLRHGFRRLSNVDSTEYRELKRYLESTCHQTHLIDVELRDIYSVFVKSRAPNPYREWISGKPKAADTRKDRLLLWHGTPVDSVMGILDVGLQIRRKGSTLTGTMFGNGIYLADAASKSAGFCKHDMFKDTDAVLLLCEVDAGEDRIIQWKGNSLGPEVVKAQGKRCIQGVGRHVVPGWKQAEWEMPGEPKQGPVWLVGF
jgi:poly [ADP-ribose] polymerase 2/3/4